MHRCAIARPSRAITLLTLPFLLLAAAAGPARAAVPGFTPAPGFAAEATGLVADTFAVAPDGRLATGSSDPGEAVITVYNHASPAGRRVLGAYSAPALRFLGGLAFAGPNTLLVSENGVQDTVFAINLSTGTVQALAPAGSVPNIAQVRVRPADGAVFAVAANPPGEGAIYRFTQGVAVPFATGLGTGYLGGFAFDRQGGLLVADTNDPDFTGAPGRIIAVNAAGTVTGGVSLAGGQGSGAYDVARDAFGALFATTGATVTRAYGGAVYPLGRFSGDFPFPTDIAVDPWGGVLVNGIFTAPGQIIRITPARGAVRQPILRPAMASRPAPRGR